MKVPTAEELKHLEMCLRLNYEDMVGGVYWSNRVYYFFLKKCYKYYLKLFTNPEGIGVYDFSNIGYADHALEHIRTEYCTPIITPNFEDVLYNAILLGYEPSDGDLFNIPFLPNSADYCIHNILELANDGKKESSGLDDHEERYDDIRSFTEDTGKYIEVLEEIIDTWENRAVTLVEIIQGYLEDTASTKKGLRDELTTLTYHHMIQKDK